MTIERALELLPQMRDSEWITALGKKTALYTDEAKEAFNMAISALEKQEQTKEAIPHRNYQYLSDYWCECGWHLGKKGDVKFCADCGRRIKWD